jgi:hypothetical protein
MGCCWPTPIVSYQPEQEGTMPEPVTRGTSEISLDDIFVHVVSPSKVEAPPPVTRESSDISLGDIFDRYKTAHPERFRTFEAKDEPPPGPALKRKNHIIT